MMEPVNRPRFKSYMEERMAHLSEMIERKKAKEAGKMAIDKTLKVGDKVRYLGGDNIEYWFGGMTCGKVYEFVERDGHLGIIDDEGLHRTFIDYDCFELVTDDSEQPTKSTADLIANLALRVSELERAQYKRKEGDDMTVNGEYRAEKRHAKVGERIVVVNPWYDAEYERGDIFPVEDVDPLGNACVDFGNYAISAEEYEVLPEGAYEAIIAEIDEADDDLDGLLAQVTEENKHRADVVDKPAHYTQGGVETIDYIAQVAGGYADGFVAHCVGTTIKYVSRAPYKHESPAEDLRKARRYLDFAIERLEGER